MKLSEDNLSRWSVYFSDFGDCALQKDMDKFKIDEIELEVQFPDMYPLHPPFFRVVRPVFCYQTGRITSGGSICVDTLTLEAWSAATRMESLLLMIKTLFVEGEGRIDPAQLGNYYNIKKQKKVFSELLNNMVGRLYKVPFHSPYHITYYIKFYSMFRTFGWINFFTFSYYLVFC